MVIYKRLIKKNGFSLVEVLIATIVMSMMMGSVLSFVQYSGQIWRKGNDKIQAQNYNRMAFELIKQELLSATSIITPSAVGKKSKRIVYKKGDIKYKISLEDYGNTGENKSTTLIRTALNSGDATTAKGDKTAVMRIARNVHYFYAKRISNKTLEVSLQIKKEQTEEEEQEYGLEIISSETMVLLAPGI